MELRVNIDYPLERMEQSRLRNEALGRFEYVDRVPVGFCLVPRYFTPIFEIPYNAIFESARDQFYWQLQFLKYRIENIPEDIVCVGPGLSVGPYFDNVLDSAALGAEVVWPENETLHSLPTIHTVDEMVAFKPAAPGTGMWGQARDWWVEMRDLARETKLTFNGAEGNVDVPHLGTGGLSPHMIAIDLVGDDFYWWQVEHPDECHAFLGKITDALIAHQRCCMKIDPRPRGGFGLAEDTATAMSPEHFREFCVPYAGKLFDTLGAAFQSGRGLHMCGDSTHLHEVLVEELRITSFDIFGYEVKPEVAARNLGGRMYLWGNISPMLMLNGTKEEVKQAALEALEAMAPCGGFRLGDGANVCPGTPLENLVVFTEAAEEYGSPQ
ncbi:MAG TPA: uroporphyrinogen decarboxylase family protein [Armatimonadota bacterium]|nr:uroporphyrinogen decarboxylase family protein [Armatimonadota bacterium]